MANINKTPILFYVRGNSMNDGSRKSLIEGDVLTCEEIDIQSVEEDRLYVIQSNGDTFVRRVTLCDNDQLTAIPLNASYEECKLNKSDVQHIYLIVMRQCTTVIDIE
ncbi:S24 family peptidase [Bacteroides sp.]|uniref:S24 family peptidase n=1 Tax=Bacteroides sp. TaxID=29523 RepID=UPI002FCC46E1